MAHGVIDAIDSGALRAEDAIDELKTLAARARILYDSGSVRKAMDSAESQRARKRA